MFIYAKVNIFISMELITSYLGKYISTLIINTLQITLFLGWLGNDWIHYILLKKVKVVIYSPHM